jgi:hypothetical protein
MTIGMTEKRPTYMQVPNVKAPYFVQCTAQHSPTCEHRIEDLNPSSSRDTLLGCLLCNMKAGW